MDRNHNLRGLPPLLLTGEKQIRALKILADCWERAAGDPQERRWAEDAAAVLAGCQISDPAERERWRGLAAGLDADDPP